MTMRVLSAFLFVFCVLALVVRQEGAVWLFGGASVALFTIDLLLTQYAKDHASAARVSRTRVGSVL
jgi:hypothetical protein